MSNLNKPLPRLGRYQRYVARELHNVRPMDSDAASRVLMSNSSPRDQIYVKTILARLDEKDVAQKVEGGYVIGPAWYALANYHRWPRPTITSPPTFTRGQCLMVRTLDKSEVEDVGDLIYGHIREMKQVQSPEEHEEELKRWHFILEKLDYPEFDK